jgi:hypothetical protein
MTQPAAGGQVEAVSSELKTQALAARGLYLHKGADESLDLNNFITNPVNPALFVTLELELLGYTVPPGLILYIDKVGIVFSSALIPQSQAIGWRVMVSGSRVLNILDPVNERFYYSMGALDEPKELAPIWVQAGDRISIVLTLAANYNTAVVISGRLSGKLIKPASPELLVGRV